MAERQSSSQNVNSTSNDIRNQNSSKTQQTLQNTFSSNFKTQHQISRESTRFEVSNTSSESHGQPAREVVFCKYNPLHVISITVHKEHERSECPDREWGPGEEIIKYNDLEEEGDNT